MESTFVQSRSIYQFHQYLAFPIKYCPIVPDSVVELGALLGKIQKLIPMIANMLSRSWVSY
jgi:hypothetical protein